jgi:hypothetical protein
MTSTKTLIGDTITILGGGGGPMPFGTTGINTSFPSVVTSTGTISTLQMPKASLDYLLDTYEMNQIVVEHKLQEQELMTLRTADVDFANHIKVNLTARTAERIVQKMSFTKVKDPVMDVTSFRGRVWVFTKDELEQLIKDAQNA